MKLAITLAWFAAISFAGGQVSGLTPEDREKLLQRLEAIRDAADSKIEARFRLAISAYRSAMSSDEATFALYMNCLEKVDFTDQGKSGQDFRDWRRQNDERLKDSAFRRALRHQLRWLVLSLQATSEDADRAQLASQAQEIIDAIVNDAKNLTGHQGVLNQDVTGSVFARAYDIGRVRIDDWVLSPGRIGEVYERILFPPHRIARRHEALRSGWTKRIQQEVSLFENWQGASDKRGGRIGMATATRSPEFEKYMTVELPNSQWKMEVDVFEHGDPLGAAMKMLDHLDKHAAHPSLREWTSEFESLLQPKLATRSAAEAPPVAPLEETILEPVPVEIPEAKEESIFID